MLGEKALLPKLFYDLSLEKLVPQDDFYRKLEEAVDLSWVRPMVANCYSDIGRPSIDPEVFLKIELIGYLEGIIYERELMRQIHDRLSLRRYIGYDLDEQVPDHSTLSKTRDLLGQQLADQIFEKSVRLCKAGGMIGGVHASGDRSLVKANASLDSLEPRRVDQTPQQFIDKLFSKNQIETEEPKDPKPPISLPDLPNYPTRLPIVRDLPSGLEANPSEIMPEEPHSETEPLPEPKSEPSQAKVVSEEPMPSELSGERAKSESSKKTDQKSKIRLSNATHVSRTDPDATIVTRPGRGPALSYSAEYWTDSRQGIITHADGFTGIVPEHETALTAIQQQRERFDLPVSSVSLDKGYGVGRLYRQLKEENVVGFVPHKRNVNSRSGPGLYKLEDFKYDAERGVYICPAEKELQYSHLQVRWPLAKHIWRAKASDCKECPQRSQCTKAANGRELQVNIYQSYYDEMDKRLSEPGARLAAIARKTGPEPRFGEGKRWQGLERAKYRGLEKFRGQVLMTAAAQNIKKYVKWIWRQGQGAGQARMQPATTLASALSLARYLVFTC